MSKNREYYSQDITWCMSECNDKSCFRHPSHIIDRRIPHSFAYYEGTEDCYKCGSGITEKIANARETNWVTEGFSDTEVAEIVASARNRVIHRRWLEGESFTEIAADYGLSRERVKRICERESKVLKRERDPLYVMIQNATDNEKMLTLTYNTLRHNGVTTIEELRATSDKERSRWRHCGVVMRELLKKICEE